MTKYDFTIDKDVLNANPYDIVANWLSLAHEHELNDPTAMALATIDANGTPSLRMVLLKEFSEKGFVFYTNYNSRKGQALLHNSKAALLFHWKSLRRQLRVEGNVQPVCEAQADAYFESRPRASQIGAWASDQSKKMKNKHELVSSVAKKTATYHLGKVPRPPHWSGFCLNACRIEFWQDGAFRLHDRFQFDRSENSTWNVSRLYP